MYIWRGGELRGMAMGVAIRDVEGMRPGPGPYSGPATGPRPNVPNTADAAALYSAFIFAIL